MSDRNGFCNDVRLRPSGVLAAALLLGLLITVLASPGAAFAQQADASAQAKAVGVIKSINGNAVSLTTDDGPTVSVTVQDSTRFVRIAPGEKDLKNAAPSSLQQLQNGDRILVRGKRSDDGKSLTAASVIVMKSEDVQSKQQKEREDWQKRGIGGLVSGVDPAAGTVTISVTTLAGSHNVVIGTTKKTIIRRYAANSVNFDEAKPSTLASVKVGDQIRARGTKNDDGTEFKAEEIVAGSFRNIAGTVVSVNAADSSLSINDVLTKKPVVVKVTPDSQLRKLPQMMAQRIAMRLKGQSPDAQPGTPATPPAAANARPEGGPPQGAPGNNARGGGDLQQMLSRLPASAINDFQKGDAVIVVSTEGTGAEVTAITVVGGVEPILTASPSGMTLSPWSLGSSSGEGPSQ